MGAGLGTGRPSRPLSSRNSLLNVCGASDERRPFNIIPVMENIVSQGTDEALAVKYRLILILKFI